MSNPQETESDQAGFTVLLIEGGSKYDRLHFSEEGLKLARNMGFDPTRNPRYSIDEPYDFANTELGRTSEEIRKIYERLGDDAFLQGTKVGLYRIKGISNADPWVIEDCDGYHQEKYRFGERVVVWPDMEKIK